MFGSFIPDDDNPPIGDRPTLCRVVPGRKNPQRLGGCSAQPATMAAMNNCLARNNKTRTGQSY
jgi:hypothetical protein